MTKPTKILVPIDFSPTSEGVLNYARAVADGFKTEVHVLHVIVNPASHGWSVETGALARLYEDMEQEARKRLEELIGKEAEGLEFSPEVAISIGAPFAEILRYAETHGIDLIVMGSHGLAGMLEQIMVGSVAEKVVRRAHCPVLVVRRPPEGKSSKAEAPRVA